ncbi:hypothetical protein SUVZ_09G0850 [Saccharomyces uvarum]|uniref:CCHC-type domain-containing protein n=1 Tax=Saccharomyces uvarum TaxID=230603 RepID=A0ABN8WWH0_SACUV|nr:hypothetical protein SUVZ_09G0850 [Saccharomyces uvarum]
MSMLLSEVESMDTLPYVKDTTPKTSDPSSSKLLAPSIEDVDANPEELRTLRGQGRYFGVTDYDADGAIMEAEPKCNNCSQRGHLKRNCPHVICTYCGSMDDHYSQHCPKAISCSNCNANGHYKSQCPQKWKKVFCTLCNSKRHSRERCPSIWRSYLLKTKEISNDELDFETIFCYNCGVNGHFGDDCAERRSSRVPNTDGSAFCGDNLAIELKQHYFNQVKNHKREVSERQMVEHEDNDQQFNFYDYEYNDDAYDYPGSRNYRDKMKWKNRAQSSRNNNNNGNKNNSYNNNNNNSSYNDNNNNKRKKTPFSPHNYNVTKKKNVHTHPLNFPRNPQNNRMNEYPSHSNYNRQDFPRGPKNKKNGPSFNKGQRNGRY